VVHGTKELVEKLGRNDPCPCGSARLFQALLPAFGMLSMAFCVMTIHVERRFVPATEIGKPVTYR
jgi:hypothetical protein